MREVFALLFTLIYGFAGNSPKTDRTEIVIPDIDHYIVLKCDFHMHTVFSDGVVWPPARVVEAWQDGMDVIAITDHIEKSYHVMTLNEDLNRPYLLAKQTAEDKNIILINGGEISKATPPGHINAIFIDDVNKLNHDDYLTVMSQVTSQQGFAFLNHPKWLKNKSDSVYWYEEHENMFLSGMIQGIEIVNNEQYYPLAHQLAIERGLTMIASSDMHEPGNIHWDKQCGLHRPMTLVMAENRSKESVKEALLAGRTILWYKDKLIGSKEWLLKLFQKSVAVSKTAKGKNYIAITFQNLSDLSFVMHPVKSSCLPRQVLPLRIALGPGKKTQMLLKVNHPDEKISLSFVLKNMLSAPGENPVFSIDL